MRTLSAFEKELISVVAGATFRPATADKRFIRRLCSGEIQQISEKGEVYLAQIAQRYRRQYTLSAEQWQWVNEKLTVASVRREEIATCPKCSGAGLFEGKLCRVCKGAGWAYPSIAKLRMGVEQVLEKV